MSKRDPRIDMVRTDAGIHNRIVGGNGEIVWTTEVYTDINTALDAIELLKRAAALTLINHVDERSPDETPVITHADYLKDPDDGADE